MINLVLALVSLIKDIVLAAYLGTSVQADAFLLAYFIIFAFGNNLLASALGVAVIPVLAGLHQNGERQRFIRLTVYLVVYTVIITTLFAFLMFGIRFGLFSWLGAGLSVTSRELSISLFILLTPSLVAFSLINMGMSIMQVNNRFNIPALAPVLFNMISLIGLLYLNYSNIPLEIGVYALAFITIFGILAMLVIVWIPILKYRIVAFADCVFGLRTMFIDRSSDFYQRSFLFPDLIAVWKSFFPYLLTILFPQIIFLFERYLASHLETGSISGLNYAFRIVQFPLWVFIAAVSTVLFPVLAKMSAIGDKQGINNELINSIYVTSLFTIPFTIILYVLRIPIITILLQRGEFNSHSVEITSSIMAGYTLTIIWQGFLVIWVRAAIVEGKVSYALIAAAVSAALNISFDIIFVPILGTTALGCGAAIGAMVNFGVIYMLFSRFSNLHFSHLSRGIFKILLANVPLLFITILFSQLWARVAESGTFIFRIGYVVIVMIGCISAYWIGLRLFKVRVTY